MTSASTSPTSDLKHHSDTNSVNTMTTTIPQILSTPGTHASQSDPKEFMKLTPVRLQCLTSPLRQGGIMPEKSEKTNYQSTQELQVDEGCRENSNLISRQLEKLLGGLDVIYRKIGYSNAEIIGKEKLIFNTLSGSMTSFFNHAESDMKNLNEENETSQEILNRMLEVIRDSSGINTIPDIYVRNAILIPSCKTVFQSPKKPLSILSKRNLLNTARGFVFKSYLPALIRYMDVSIKLQALIEVVGEKLGNLPNGGEMINNLPSLESLKHYREDLKSHQTDFDFILKYFMDHKRELLYSNYFDDISKDKLQILGQSIQVYQEEYNSRISQLKATSENISQLVVELKTNLDPQIQRLLSIYVQLDSHATPKMYMSVHKTTIECLRKVLQEQQAIYIKRKEIKEALLVRCESLWNKLKVPQAYIDSFLNYCEGYSIAVTKKIIQELAKLEEMKKKLIKTLIEESSQRIEELWTFLQYDDEEKSQFLYTFRSLKESSTTLEDDEKLLETCENEIKSLEERLNVYKPTLQLVQDFESLRADKLSLEKSSKDSTRLLARNSHKILLHEEKTRKRVTRHFPRVIKDLKNGLEDIQITFGKPLVVNGRNMMNIVTQVEEELIKKYPKSRLNLGRTNARRPNYSTKSNNNNEGKVAKNMIPEKGRKSTIPVHTAEIPATSSMTQTPAAAQVRMPLTSTRTSNFINQTPVTKITGCFPKINESTTSHLDSSQNKKYMRGFKAATPTIQENSLLPPKLVTRFPNSRIPEPSRITRVNSENLSSSPIFQPQPPAKLARPTTLFQMSSNKINQQESQIPILSKSSSLLSQEFINNVGKENLMDSTPRLQQKNEFLNFSSPYREPDNSVYKISKSPDGKCTIKVHEDSHLENGFDDTSILD